MLSEYMEQNLQMVLRQNNSSLWDIILPPKTPELVLSVLRAFVPTTSTTLSFFSFFLSKEEPSLASDKLPAVLDLYLLFGGFL